MNDEIDNYVKQNITVNFSIQKLKNKGSFPKKSTNWAKLSSLNLTEREETKTKYFVPQSQFSPMNQPPFYGPRPKYGSGFAGFLEMLSLPYLSQGYGNPEMGLDSSGSSSDRIRFEVCLH